MTTKSQVTFGQTLTIISILIIPLFVWGIRVETRFQNNRDDIGDIEEDVKILKADLKESKKSNQENFDKVLDKLHDVEVILMNKQDREN